MNKQKKTQAVVIGALVGFGVLLVAAVAGLAQAMVSLDRGVVSRTPEAILASAGVTDGADIDLPVAYLDQKQDECVNMYDASLRKELEARQFEWASCGYNNSQLEQGIVAYDLGEDYLPVAIGGELLPNRALGDMTRWFNGVDGKSKEYTGSLRLVYRTGEGVEFSFADNDFYPLDEAKFSAGDVVNKDGHNHLWTMSFAVPFAVVANGEESFEIAADDDTFVYVGTELALDMGGVHDATVGKFVINEAGEVYTGIDGEELAYSGITVGGDSIVRIFHADRDAGNGSTMRIKMSGMKLNVVQTQLAGGADGVQVAYDPSDPSYVGPLGESEVAQPDETKMHIIAATILGVAIMMLAVFVMLLVRILVRQRAELRK